jgi:hypothetical protein
MLRVKPWPKAGLRRPWAMSVRLLAVGSRQRAARNLLTQRIARVLLEQLG